jgi:hypothetical protein
MLETEIIKEIQTLETNWETIQPIYEKNPDSFAIMDSKLLERFSEKEEIMKTLSPLREDISYLLFTESNSDGLILRIPKEQTCTLYFERDPLDLNSSINIKETTTPNNP